MRNKSTTYLNMLEVRLAHLLMNVTVPLPTESIIQNAGTECKQVTKVVYIKTHKTASSTMSSIIQRFGDSRNLSFAVPPRGHILSSRYGFKQNMLNSTKYPPLNGGTHYDILTNHVGYNRHEMEAVIPNATYITVLRHPVNQLVSAFAYFEWTKAVKAYRRGSADLFATFMERPTRFLTAKMKFWWQGHNGQLYDLGLQTQNKDTGNKLDDLVYKYIEVLDRELDLVLITEYFDESLLILKKQLCWSMDDILYFSKGLGASHHIITQQTRDKILKWNRGDLLLYQ
ncbi:galactosylceramide sulfotransferase-like, partial [Saccoglossus kowalevskii]